MPTYTKDNIKNSGYVRALWTSEDIYLFLIKYEDVLHKTIFYTL